MLEAKTISFSLIVVLIFCLDPLTPCAASKEQQQAAGVVPLEEEGLSEEFELLEETRTVEAAARHKQEIGMSSQSITVVTREDIETFGSSNIPDLLRLVPGLHVAMFSPMFIVATTRREWSSSGNDMRVLVDNREINFEFLGAPVWEMEPTSIGDIERIEVVRGPASALYGTNAFTGVIKITTRAIPDKTSVLAKLTGGEWGTFGASGRASTRLGPWGISISGMADQSGTWVDPGAQAAGSWKFRSLFDYRWSQGEKLTLDIGLTKSSGSIPADFGTAEVEAGYRAVRLAYSSEKLSGHLYWCWTPSTILTATPLQFGTVRLATIPKTDFGVHVLDGEVQWEVPEFYQPLLIILGGSGRLLWFGSRQLLDANSYTDSKSSNYHRPGLDMWSLRGGAYAHTEYSPWSWATLTAGLRFDYNADTSGELSFGDYTKERQFLSYRLALVLEPVEGHFLRIGTGNSFRKPSVMETAIHPRVQFPSDSPIQGTQQEIFWEFMTRVIGNWNLNNTMMWSIEGGYTGYFLGNRLLVSADLYYNEERGKLGWDYQIVSNELGLPDLRKSSYLPDNRLSQDTMGFELSARWFLSKSISLLSSWTYTEVLTEPDASPKNLFTLGGRFKAWQGLVGSLYLFSRSEFLDKMVENPTGILAPRLVQHMDQVFLTYAKCGWQWLAGEGIQLEVGANLLLPISPFGPSNFRYYEKGGGVTPEGKLYGGSEIGRLVSLYLQGSY